MFIMSYFLTCTCLSSEEVAVIEKSFVLCKNGAALQDVLFKAMKKQVA